MSNQMIKTRTGWTASLGWLVEPVMLLVGCGLLFVVGILGVRLTEGNLRGPVSNLRDEARSELDALPWHAVEGQRLYVPAYSHVYHHKGDPCFLAVTLNIRNTDVNGEIVVTSVRYFDTVGKELRSLLDKPLKLSPMATTEFVIARDERAHRSGASFLVEWKAGTKVRSPLVETLNFDTSCKQALSFVAPAIVLDETELIEQVPQAGT